jgi:N-acetyl-alpha-D-muramate 1-phosphate uridylyltransferase
MSARLLLASMEEQLGYDGAGDFVSEPDGRIAFRDDRPNAPWAYMGVQIVDPVIVAPEPIAPFSFTRIWRRVVQERRLFGAPLIGYWMHVGDPGARAEAEERLAAAALTP